MTPSGIGIIGPFGRGADAYRAALAGAYPPPAAWPGCDHGPSCLRIPDALLSTPDLGREGKRADRLTRMLLAAALDAASAADLGLASAQASTGLILATGLGPHAISFRFLDDLLDFGQEQPSPTSFAHSVHNAPLHYLSRALGITGPSLTVTGFVHAFPSAWSLATDWLANCECRQVMIVAGDELGKAMLDVIARWYPPSKPPVWGEGAVAFLLRPGTPSCPPVDMPTEASCSAGQCTGAADDPVVRAVGHGFLLPAFRLAAQVVHA
jgi:3-oxoacyl-(acyl-carrier-protein) synthase